MSASAAPSLSHPDRSGTRWRDGLWPFARATIPNALLSALLIQLSVGIAPGAHLVVASWVLTFLSLYLGLGRATFLRSYDLVYGHRAWQNAVPPSAKRAFREALKRSGALLLSAAAVILALGVGADVVTKGLDANTRAMTVRFLLAIAGLAWMMLCPRFLVACWLWVPEPEASGAGRDMATLREAAKGSLIWFAFVIGILAVSGGAYLCLYLPLRAAVASLFASDAANLAFGTAFLTCLIAFQFVAQSFYPLTAGWGRSLGQAENADGTASTKILPFRSRRSNGIGFLTGIGMVIAGALLAVVTIATRPAETEAYVLDTKPICLMLFHRPETGWRQALMPCEAAEAAQRADHPEALIEKGRLATLRLEGETGTAELFLKREFADAERRITRLKVIREHDPKRPDAAPVLRRPPPNFGLGDLFVVVIGLLYVGAAATLIFGLALRGRPATS